ncbi:MAG: 4Fe-4S cluster-binding domain-containing protein [Candidatus Woesearchaeota archaeon]
MNITNKCPFGCSSCYKGEYTRIEDAEFFTSLAKAANIQSQALVKYINQNSDIASVIISGGEPLLLDNIGINKILENFRKIKNSNSKNTNHKITNQENIKQLVELRICTGALFQGWPFRIDDELLRLLKDYENDTGTIVHFNVHLSHPAQFTPESIKAIKRIRKYGFCINSQVPLQRDVNIFLEDKTKTLNTLYKLAELQARHGIRPYKYILHMHSGSLEYSVPLEFMLNIIGELKYRTDHPLPETWQPVSFSILCKEGNILLTPQMRLGLGKSINQDKGYVEYKIPVPYVSKDISMSSQHDQKYFKYVAYREPLVVGIND